MADYPDALCDTLAEKYELFEVLGEGGMGTVYLARDLKHDRKVALKTIHPELASTQVRDRFNQEIRITSHLQHPHILPLLDSGVAGETLYYVMPFVEGESLRGRLDREGKLRVDEAIRIVRDVAGAVSYAHDLGVIHRDIKPENILLTAGRPMVADFGIARAIAVVSADRLTKTGLALGSPSYMSPEQWGGDTPLDERSDLYSLGCVAYELLAGQPPFVGPTAHAVLVQALVDPPPSLRELRPGVPEGVERVIERALAKAPADRFATVNGFAQALAAGSGYEFDAQQNELVGDLATRMLWVAYFLVLAGVLVGIGGLATRSQRGILSLIPAGFMILIGVWTKRAAAAFDGIVQTEGSDIVNLMVALDELDNLYTLQFWVIAFSIGILGLIILIILGLTLWL
jgi:serine/threonine-protein kinase